MVNRQDCSRDQKCLDLSSGIRHFHISHNAPYLPPPPQKKNCVTFFFSFLLGITFVPRAIKNKVYAKCLGDNKVHCGKGGSGVFLVKLTTPSLPPQTKLNFEQNGWKRVLIWPQHCWGGGWVGERRDEPKAKKLSLGADCYVIFTWKGCFTQSQVLLSSKWAA